MWILKVRLNKKDWRRAALLCLLAAALLGCAGLSEPQESPAEHAGDLIGTAVAGTLAVSEQETATAFAVLDATASAQETQAAIQAATETAVATASAVPDLPTPTPEPTPSPTGPGAAATITREPQAIVTDDLVVAYIGSSRDLWVWQDGVERQLTVSGDVMEVTVSDDGEWIAFTRSPDLTRYSLWVIRPSGSDERQLMESAEFEELPHDNAAVTVVPVGIAWKPLSHTLAFSTRPTFEGPGLLLNDDLWIIDVDSGQRRELLPAGEGGRFYYSPDGEQIALVQPTSISVVDEDGQNRRDNLLTYPEVSTYSEYRFYATPQWSQDGQYLRVVIPPPASLENPEDSATIWEVRLDETPAVQLSSVMSAPLMFPLLSPDITQVAYLRQVGAAADNRLELHIAGVDGSQDEVYVTDIFLQFINWAPDSQRFVFSVGENYRVYLGEAGQTPQPLSDTQSALEVRWLDANHFFFIERSGTGYELRMGTVGQASAQILGFEEATEHFPMYDFAIP